MTIFGLDIVFWLPLAVLGGLLTHAILKDRHQNRKEHPMPQIISDQDQADLSTLFDQIKSAADAAAARVQAKDAQAPAPFDATALKSAAQTVLDTLNAIENPPVPDGQTQAA